MDLPGIAQSYQLFRNIVTSEFHDYYRQSNQEGPPGPPWATWRGYVALKCPLDMWIYQEMIANNPITHVLENGTAGGGSALFIADLLESLNRGYIISTDIDFNLQRPLHDRLEYVQGDTLNVETPEKVLEKVYQTPPLGQRLLILDDGHSAEHVEEELKIWSPILHTGDWLIVEDTNLGGPYWGLQAWLRTQPEGKWERQVWCEKFSMTHNPWGYWRRVA